MNENITPVNSKEIFSVTKNSPLSDLKPSERTLSFIRQFARCYHEEKRIPAPLGGIILN
jgi:hypothetical protein